MQPLREVDCGVVEKSQENLRSMRETKAVLAYCREKGIKAVDLRFVDVAGDWRHITFPVTALTEACFEEGFGHDIVLSHAPAKGARHCVFGPEQRSKLSRSVYEQPTLVLIASVQDC